MDKKPIKLTPITHSITANARGQGKMPALRPQRVRQKAFIGKRLDRAPPQATNDAVEGLPFQQDALAIIFELAQLPKRTGAASRSYALLRRSSPE
jgi:hypothetical protein